MNIINYLYSNLIISTWYMGLIIINIFIHTTYIIHEYLSTLFSSYTYLLLS